MRQWQAAKAAVLALLACFLAWVAVQSAAADAWSRSLPGLAAAVAPADPRSSMSAAIPQFGLDYGQLSPAAEQAAIAASAKAPLADEPFTLKALAALAKQDMRRAQGLLEEARRRQPRSRIVRLLLLDLHLRNDRIREATAEMVVLARLLPEAVEALTPQLARFARNPRTRNALSRALNADPDMKVALLHHLAGTAADPDLILRLAEPWRPSAPGTSAPQWQGTLVHALVERGELGRAHELWARFAGLQGRSTGVYDGSFEQRPGGPPFNWLYPANGTGLAEPRGGKLQVSYFGQAEGELARQMLVLPAGRYRLSLRAQGQGSTDGGRVAWQVACKGAPKPLAEISLAGVGAAPKPFEAIFAVPAACPAQLLTLVGIMSELPKPQDVTVDEVRIERVGGS